jgi:hypothetical protein
VSFLDWFKSGSSGGPRSSRRAAVPPGGYLIEFDMMVKGSVYKRRSGLVRQFGVTVDGATRLVTSGDIVDRQTYDALLAVGAIRTPRPPATDPEFPQKPPAPQQGEKPNKKHQKAM